MKILQKIQKFADGWDAAYAAGDMAALGSYYAGEASIVPAGGSPLTGASIKEFFTDLKAKGFVDHKITVQSANVNGGVILAVGTWKLQGPEANGERNQFQGNWINALGQDGDDWRILLHTWN